MKTTVYADVLFCVNLIIDYVILLSVKKTVSLRARKRRLLLGAAVGALGSFAVLLPPLPFGVSVLTGIAVALLMTAAAFMPLGIWAFIRTAMLLFAVSFAYCGLMTAVLMLASPKNLTVRNGSVYIGISPFTLVALTLVCYLALRLFGRIRESGIKGRKCRVIVRNNGLTAETDGIADTGSTLREPFSGEMVIVGRSDVFACLSGFGEYPDADGQYGNARLRMVPFSSVGGRGLLPAFRPEEITIVTETGRLRVEAYLALSGDGGLPENCGAIVPAELITEGSR